MSLNTWQRDQASQLPTDGLLKESNVYGIQGCRFSPLSSR